MSIVLAGTGRMAGGDLRGRAAIGRRVVDARQPLVERAAVEWSTAAGTRYQLSPRVALDGGAGYLLTGDDEGWFVTFGAALSVGIPWSPRR